MNTQLLTAILIAISFGAKAPDTEPTMEEKAYLWDEWLEYREQSLGTINTTTNARDWASKAWSIDVYTITAARAVTYYDVGGEGELEDMADPTSLSCQ